MSKLKIVNKKNNNRDKKRDSQRWNKWHIFRENDSLVSKDGYIKKDRRYLIVDKKENGNIKVAEITKIKGKEDKIREGKILVISDKNPTITKPSGVNKITNKTTYRNNPKGDILNISHLKNTYPQGKLLSEDRERVQKFLKSTPKRKRKKTPSK